MNGLLRNSSHFPLSLIFLLDCYINIGIREKLTRCPEKYVATMEGNVDFIIRTRSWTSALYHYPSQSENRTSTTAAIVSATYIIMIVAMSERAKFSFSPGWEEHAPYTLSLECNIQKWSKKKVNNRIKMGVKQCQIYIFALHFDYHYISLRLFAHSPMRVWLLRCACVTAVCAADITCSIICGWSVFWSSLSLVEERTKETTTANKWKEEVNLAFETENCFFFFGIFHCASMALPSSMLLPLSSGRCGSATPKRPTLNTRDFGCANNSLCRLWMCSRITYIINWSPVIKTVEKKNWIIGLWSRTQFCRRWRERDCCSHTADGQWTHVACVTGLINSCMC